MNDIRYSSDNIELNEYDWTFQTYLPTHDSQIVAKEWLELLANLIIEKNGKLWEPAIIWIEWNPWLWKSHLLNSFKLKLKEWGIGFTHNTDMYFLQNHAYSQSGIIILDDLFQNVSSFDDLNGSRNIATMDYIKQMIFDIYEHKKILIVSSNLDIKKVLQVISSTDEVWRLKDRITELLSHTMPLKLEWRSYREIKAEKAASNSEIAKIFDLVKSKVPYDEKA